ncbi:MAG: type IV pilus biogenesis/stability protein PilW [Burkholderiales bacterium]|nr:type IV pilus biogenesis/stability protein PilW [Burkholderiales bacterium]
MKWLLISLLLLVGCAGGGKSASTNNPPAQQPDPDYLDSARIHTELAAAYYSRRQYEVALEELGLALRALPNHGPAYNMRGLVYMELKEDAKAAQDFSQALRLNPNDPDANNNYGWFLCQRDDPAKSIAYFTAALRNSLYTTPEKSLVNAGICSRKANAPSNAENYFRQALAIHPNQPQALYHLADLSFQRDAFEESRAYLSRYVRADNPTAEALWLGVRTERRLNDRGAEASYAAQLCRRYPNSRECQAVKSGADR